MSRPRIFAADLTAALTTTIMGTAAPARIKNPIRSSCKITAIAVEPPFAMPSAGEISLWYLLVHCLDLTFAKARLSV